MSLWTRTLRLTLACAVALAAMAVPARALAFGATDTLRASQTSVCEAAQLTPRTFHARFQVTASRSADGVAAALTVSLDTISRAGLSSPAVAAPVDRPLRSTRSSSPDRAPPVRS